MLELINHYRKYDPAARGFFEVLFLYPGVRAICFHRVANFFWKLKCPFLPRLVSEMGRFLTGIEIHPGATVGRAVIIDHGMGTVVGETAVVEDYVILYQQVTLGGTRLDRVKRHPTIRRHVVVGAGAKVLGNIEIGEHSRIGANSVVVSDVPPHSTVVGIPARIIKKGVKEGEELCHDQLM